MMADSSGRDLFPTEEVARRIIDAVGIELPASSQYAGWFQDFQNQLSEVLKVGWYASLGMVDPSADEDRGRLRRALAAKEGIEPNDHSLRRFGDSHIREMVEQAGWFFERWWDRPFAASRTHETEHAESRGGGPAARLLQAIATELLDAIKGDVLPSIWPKASSVDAIDRIGEQLRALAEGSETARNRIRASPPYKLLRRLRSHLNRKSAHIVESGSDETGDLDPAPVSAAHRNAVLEEAGEESRLRIHDS